MTVYFPRMRGEGRRGGEREKNKEAERQREREKQSERICKQYRAKRILLIDLILELTHCLFPHSLPIRNETLSLSPKNLKGRGYMGYSEAEITEYHLKGYLPQMDSNIANVNSKSF
jgi:hypothetical protein